MNLTATPDRSLIRAGARSRRYLLVTFTAPDAPPRPERTPVNVSFVLDRSGSMEGSKIALARRALALGLRMLRPEDRFSVVLFDDQIDLLMPSTRASADAVAQAVTWIERVQARGTTDLGNGWLQGCEQIARRLAPEQIGRCLLLSDGHANVGITDLHELAARARQLRSRGVATSTFGIGDHFDELLLQAMAEAGGGNAYYVESAGQIPDYVTSELGEALEVVARDAAVRIQAEPGVTVETLHRFEVSTDPDGARAIELGSLVARQAVSLVLALTFPPGEEEAVATVEISLGDAEGNLPGSPIEVPWTYASHEANDAQPRNPVVDRRVAALYAARAREQALEHNRRGDFTAARRVVERTAARILEYAGQDPELNTLAGELHHEAARFGEHLQSADLKVELYAAYNVRRMRDASGKSDRHAD